MLNRIN